MKKMMMAVGGATASVLTPVMVCAALLLWVIACDVAAFLFPVDVPEWPFHFDLTLSYIQIQKTQHLYYLQICTLPDLQYVSARLYRLNL